MTPSMVTPTSDFFASFRPHVFGRYQSFISDDETREATIGALSSYLQSWNEKQWVDEETIYLLGRDIFSQTSPDLRQRIVDWIKSSKIDGAVLEIFLAGFSSRERELDAIPSSLPSIEELNAAIIFVASGYDYRTIETYNAISIKYIRYAERTGDVGPTIFAINKLSNALIESSYDDVAQTHLAITSATTRLMAVNARDDGLWRTLARSLINAGDPLTASLLLWDGVRRVPDNPRLHSMLLVAMRRSKYNYQNQIRLAKYACGLFRYNRVLNMQLCHLLGYSAIYDQVIEGVSKLVKFMRDTNKLEYEPGLLASIINKNWDKLLLQEEDAIRILELIVDELKEKPKLVGGLAYRLMRYHKNAGAAIQLLRVRLERASGLQHTRALNQLARAFAFDRDPDGLNAAIDMLMPLNDNVSRNHVAKLLESRGQEGDLGKARKKLEEVLAVDEFNGYAINQLASILMTGGNNGDLEEARELLRRIPDDVYAREKLRALDKGKNAVAREEQLSDHDFAEVDSPEFSELAETGGLGISQATPKALNLRHTIPNAIIRCGTLRQAQFEIETGTKNSRVLATEKLKRMSFDEKSEYEEFINTTYVAKVYREDRSASIAVKILAAFSEKNAAVLKELEARYPRYTPVINLAMAADRNQSSLEYISNVIKMGYGLLSPEKAILVNLLKSTFANDNVKILRNIQEENNRSFVRDIIRRLSP